MRARGIEKLAWMLSQEPENATLGEIANRYGESIDRIMDGYDALKIRQGKPTQLPPVPWGVDAPTDIDPAIMLQLILYDNGMLSVTQPENRTLTDVVALVRSIADALDGGQSIRLTHDPADPQ